jgi:hypothetical protein
MAEAAALFLRIVTMTQKITRIEINLVPLKLFCPRRLEDRKVPGYSPLPDDDPVVPDCQSAPTIGSEAHLMTFSVMPRQSIAPFGGQASYARTSAFTLYVTGTLFDHFCFALQFDRLVKTIEERSPPVDVVLN